MTPSNFSTHSLMRKLEASVISSSPLGRVSLGLPGSAEMSGVVGGSSLSLFLSPA